MLALLLPDEIPSELFVPACFFVFGSLILHLLQSERERLPPPVHGLVGSAQDVCMPALQVTSTALTHTIAEALMFQRPNASDALQLPMPC